MHNSKGSMGSHKHGTSGRAPRSPAYKQKRTREANALADAEHAKRLQREHKTYMSIAAAMKDINRN